MYFNIMKIRDIEDFRKVSHSASIFPAERNALQTPFDLWKKTDNGRLRPCAFVGMRESGRMRRVTTNDPSTLAYAFTLTLSDVEACARGYRFTRPDQNIRARLSLLSVYSFRSGPGFGHLNKTFSSTPFADRIA